MLDWLFDWSAWLQSGETLETGAVVADGLDVGDTAVVNDGAAVRVWLSGGVTGNTYTVTCSVTTSQGRADDRSFVLKIEDR